MKKIQLFSRLLLFTLALSLITPTLGLSDDPLLPSQSQRGAKIVDVVPMIGDDDISPLPRSGCSGKDFVPSIALEKCVSSCVAKYPAFTEEDFKCVGLPLPDVEGYYHAWGFLN